MLARTKHYVEFHCGGLVPQLAGKDRLIVALDVPTHELAVQLVDQLDNVSFFKVGLELFLTGDILGFLKRLQQRRAGEGGVFVDLKLGGDIGNTIASLIKQLQVLNVKFLTLVESVPLAITLNSVKVARATRGDAADPKLLMVPCLSSLDQSDLRDSGINQEIDEYIVSRAKTMIEGGCDGLIVSGKAIQLCRATFPKIVLVSPGIRPAWASRDDHKRITTPTEAIRLGSDYLVVGRPITQNPDPRGAAQLVIDEIDEALSQHRPWYTSNSLAQSAAPAI